MLLEDQVCSLELAKKLKKLEVKQDSYFMWYSFENPLQNIFEEDHVPDNHWNLNFTERCSKYGADWTLSAFTVAELGEMLPVKIGDEYLTTHRCIRNGWWIFYSSEDNDDHSFNSFWDASSEVNIRARMLIYLIENNLVKVEDINNV